MQKIKVFLGAFGLASLLTSCAMTEAPPVVQTNNSQSRLDEYHGQKFGMFIHWGLYSVPAGVYKGEPLRGISEWIQKTKNVPLSEYRQYRQQMTLANYQPEQWVALAKQAGMQYMVITAKHHDGFAMFDSAVSDYDMLSTPYRADPLTPLVASAQQNDLDIGFYYSQDQDWEDPNARGNTLEFDPSKAKPEVYLANKALPQLKELVNNYGDIDFIWFDTPGALSYDQASSLKQAVKTAQPDVLINARIGHNLGDFAQTGDNAIPLQVWDSQGKWETPATINHSWGYHQLDNHWREPRDLLGKLVDIVSKGGNYLLNIGPRADGSIPQPSIDILHTMGDWLARNGAGIYNTGHCPFYYDQIDWRCTTKPGKLYLHMLDWQAGNYRVRGIQTKVTAVKILDGGVPVAFEQNDTLQLMLPERDNTDEIITLELSLADKELTLAPGYHHSKRPDTVELFALSARFRGQDIKYNWQSNSAHNFKDISKEPGYDPNKLTYRNELWWYPYGTLHGDYKATLHYSCTGNDLGEVALRSQSTNADDKVNNRISYKMALKCDGSGKQSQAFEQTIPLDQARLKQFVFAVDKWGKDTSSLSVHKVTLTRVH